MADPQLENGYTRIANELIEALAKAMPGFTEGQIIWALIRKLYGWHKKEDTISIGQLQELTGKSRRGIIYALQNLEAKRMIRVTRNSTYINSIALNKNYDQWLPNKQSSQYANILHRRRELHRATSASGSLVQEKVVQETEKGSRILAPTKETIITKENTSIEGEKRKVFGLLKERRGIDSPNGGAEGKAIVWMLGHGFTADQIIATYDRMKAEPFWRDKPLMMMSVQKQIALGKPSEKTYTPPDELRRSYG